MELLTGVLVVCRERPCIDALWHVKKLIDEFAVGCNSLEEAAWRNNTRLMARVIHATDMDSTLSKEDKLKTFTATIDSAVLLGNLRIEEQLYAHQPSSLCYEVATKAVFLSDLPLLKWFKANNLGSFNCREWEIAFYVALEHRCLETVQWLVAAFSDTIWPLAPGVSQPEVIKWLHDEHVNLHTLLTPIPDIVQESKYFVVKRELLDNKYKLQQALAAAMAKLARLRPRKRTIEEPGIVDG